MTTRSRAFEHMFRRHFVYDSSRPLQEGQIRLIKLLPGRDPSTIKCLLYTVNLCDNPVYEALSYHWGVEWREHTILLNGKKFKSVDIRFSLLTALIHLRNPSKERTLWIDAICINQRNDSEKALQVQQMGKVYSKAAGVIVWLELADEYSRMTFNFLRQLTVDELDDEAITSIFKANYNENTGKRLDLALADTLNSNRYWRRLWIIQEILLASHDIILCSGHEQISWKVVGKALDRLNHYLSALPPKPQVKGYLKTFDLSMAVEHGGAAGLHRIKAIQRSSHPSPNILRRLLGMAQRAQCQTMHDKIYGLLGMTDFNIPVDYNKTMFELYVDAMYYFRHALVEGPQDQYETYTMKLSQVFHELLNNPCPEGITGSTVSCVKMAGILCGEILQVDYRKATTQLQDSEASKQKAKVSKDQIEREEEVTERLNNIFLLREQSTGCKVGLPNERLIFELVNCPRRHLVWKCIPHYFYAMKRPKCIDLATKVPVSVPRVGSVPIGDPPRWRDVAESKLFLASHIHAPPPSGNLTANTMAYLIGFATPEAQIGDEIVRFLESDFCLVVRHIGLGEYKFVGCASIPESGDPCTDARVHEEAKKIDHRSTWASAPSYAQFQSAFQDPIGYGLDIVIDLEALQHVTNMNT